MRIWSLHPKYLDTQGLIALWRETLLAKHVLEGKTKGYRNHPQLDRFKSSINPSGAINQYLAEVYHEASRRNYSFNRGKINWDYEPITLPVTRGQIDYEYRHLLNKLRVRDKSRLEEFSRLISIESHPLFEVIEGEVEKWEIVKNA